MGLPLCKPLFRRKSLIPSFPGAAPRRRGAGEDFTGVGEDIFEIEEDITEVEKKCFRHP